MKVFVANTCGFCRGVQTAIRMAEQTLAEGKDVYSLGEVIHNKDVVQRLASAGLKTVDSVDKIPSGTVLIRSHGATLEQLRQINEKGLEVVDATCVLVKKVQKLVKKLCEEGYKALIIGDKGHPEVQAIVGSADDVAVVGDESDIAKLPENSKLGVVCQTTQSPEHFAQIVAEIVKASFSELKIVDTLCKEAKKRQACAVELCKRVDVMFVLGGLNSANTKKLAELCKKHNNRTFLLQNWKELDKSMLFDNNVAGVTAGASTPKMVIDEFVEKLSEI